jgi:hypothetical protein
LQVWHGLLKSAAYLFYSLGQTPHKHWLPFDGVCGGRWCQFLGLIGFVGRRWSQQQHTANVPLH